MKKPIAALLFVSATGGLAVVAAADNAPPPVARPEAAVRRTSAAAGARKVPPAPAHYPLPKASVRPLPPAARPDGLMPSEYLPTSQLHAGMHGYGLSVFHGNKIERFDVAILGVVHKANNGRDLILARLSGPGLISSSNFIEGMSGSPVYVNGKIVGAVSMSFQFVREPIGFLTPITDMLDAWDPALPQSPDFALPKAPGIKSVSLSTPIIADGHRYTRLAIARPGDLEAIPQRSGRDTLVARPCMTRLSVAGVPASRFSRLAKALKKFGVDAQEGPGAAASSELTGSPFVPGGGIGVSLMTGDIDMTGIGTLTYRRGGRIVAFGHPFLGIGPIDAPMFSVYIHDIFPSYEISFKEGSPVERVGAISQDLPFSIGGLIGAEPKMVPITVHVDDKMLGRDRVFHAQIVRHPQMTPALVPSAADTAIVNVHGQPGDAMATVTTEVVADEVGVIRRTNRVYDATAIDDAATADLGAICGLLTSNPFYPVAIRSVNMTVTIERGRQTAQVERIFLKQTKFAPGDTVDVGVVLKPYKQDRVVKTIQVKIPPTAPTGSLILTVQGGSSSGGAVRIGGFTLVPSGGSDYASAANIQQLVKRYEDKDRNDALTAHLALPMSVVSVGGEKLSDLPPNLDLAMRSGTRTSGVRLERDEVKVSTLTPFVLSGAQALAIRVVRPDQSAAPGFSFPGMAPGSGIPVSPAPPGTAPFPGAPPLADRAANGPSGAVVAASAADADQRASAPRAAQPPVAGTIPVKMPPVPPAAGNIKVNFSLIDPMSGASPAAASEPHSVVRAPAIWRQDGVADFRQGKLEGVTVTSRGDVRLAPRLAKVVETDQPYFWSLAEGGDAGTVFAGGGDNGVIYRIGADGKAEPWARTGELEVLSLARGADGALYAGTAPHGRVFKIAADGGKPVLICQTNEKYVLDLGFSPDGKTLYAGTGGPTGCIYAISAAASSGAPAPKPIYSSTDSSISALTVAPDGILYAGTAPNALVVRIDPNAAASGVKPAILYDAVAPSISGLAVGKEGVVYASTAPRGVVYRIDPAPAGGAPNTARVLYDKTPNGGALTGLQIGADGMLYTASGSTVIAIDPSDSTVQTYEAGSDIDILSILRGSGGDLWIATGNTAGVYRLAEGAAAASSTQGKFVSGILDAQSTARWGTIRWIAGVPPGAGLALETRSGNTTTPDATWSDWSRGYSASSGDQVVSPPGRYLQYSAMFSGGAASTVGSPILHSVEVFYLTPNQAPQVELIAPRGGEVWRGKKTVRWSASDPDRDTLSYALSISGDGGKSWKPLNAPGSLSGQASSVPVSSPIEPPGSAPLRPASLLPPVASNVSDTARALSELEAELNRHPEIGAEMRARILADAPGQLTPPTSAAEGGEPAGGASDTAVLNAGPRETRGTNLAVDTSVLPDGEYLLKVVASDKPSNPAGALSDEKISGAFRIANRPPTLVLLNHSMKVQDDHSVRLEGIALHPSVAIRGVQYRVDGGEWLAASANDGIFDSATEAFTIVTAPLTGQGAHLVEVMAVDEAGNTITQKTTTP